MRTLLAVTMALLLCACGRKPSGPVAPVREYSMQGAVINLDPPNRMAKIKHQEIKGWMGAMTMDYQVRDKNDFARLQEGDQIAATVFVQGDEFWIGKIKTLNR